MEDISGAINGIAEDGETREDKFRRIASNRVNRILGDLTLIEQMSSTSNYRYTMEDVEVMLGAIDKAVERVRQRYMLALTAGKPEKARHSFRF